MRAYNRRNRPKHVTRGRYTKNVMIIGGFTQRDMSNSRRISDWAYRLLENEWVVVHYHSIAYYWKRGSNGKSEF